MASQIKSPLSSEDKIPKEPPKDLIKWLHTKGKLNDNLMIYKVAYVKSSNSASKTKCVHLKCTACGETMYAPYTNKNACMSFSKYKFKIDDKVYESYDRLKCPACGADVKAICIDRFYQNTLSINKSDVMVFTKCENSLVCTGYSVIKITTKAGDISYKTYIDEAYVEEKNTLARFSCIYWDENEIVRKKRFDDGWRFNDLVYPLDKDVLTDTGYENCKLDLYLAAAQSNKKEKYSSIVAPITYLWQYHKHKNIENLLVAGFGKIVVEIVKKACDKYSYNYVQDAQVINWKEKSPYKMLGITREESRIIKNEKWDIQKLAMYKKCIEYEKAFKIENIKELNEINEYEINQIISDYKWPLLKTIRYLKKQKAHGQKNVNLYMLKDYLNLAKQHGYDLESELIRWPTKLMAAHDKLVEIVKIETSEKLKSKFKELAKRFAPLCYEKDGICIRIAENENELIEEGKTLKHCVGGFGKEHCNGKCIFFVRKSNAPNVPWFTLQIDINSKKELQLHGYKNEDCGKIEIPQDVIDFILHWKKTVLADFDIEKGVLKVRKCKKVA